MQTARLPLTFACFSLDLALCGFGWGAGDAPTYRALDKEDESLWYPRSLKELFILLSEAEPHIFLQLRFDGAYRKKACCAAIGVAIELVSEGGSSRPLFDLGLEASCDNSYRPRCPRMHRSVYEDLFSSAPLRVSGLRSGHLFQGASVEVRSETNSLVSRLKGPKYGIFLIGF